MSNDNNFEIYITGLWLAMLLVGSISEFLNSFRSPANPRNISERRLECYFDLTLGSLGMKVITRGRNHSLNFQCLQLYV